MTVSKELLAFWRDAGMGKWFGGGVAFDEECRARWQDAHFAAARREHDGWMETADGALALVLLLVSDQPMIPEGVKTEASDARVSAEFVRNHIKVGIESLKLIRRNGKSVRHLRFDE